MALYPTGSVGGRTSSFMRVLGGATAVYSEARPAQRNQGPTAQGVAGFGEMVKHESQYVGAI